MKENQTKTIICWIQHIFIAPFQPIEDSAACKTARLLTLITSAILLCTITGAIATAQFVPFISASLTVATLFITVAYLLSRTKYFEIGVLFLSLVFVLIPYLHFFSTDDYSSDNIISIFSWGLLPIVLSHIFWPVRNVILLTVCHILGLLMLPLIVPMLPFTAVIHTCGFIVTISVAIIVSMYYRSQLDLERTRLVQKQADELANTNQKLETLLYVTSHDLKEPLRAMQSFSRMVNQRYANQLDSKGQDFLHRIDRAATRLSLLIRDILTLSRAQKIEAPPQQIAVEIIVQEVLSHLDDQIVETEATVSIAGELPLLYANRVWARQAIYNLVHNALKYTHEDRAPEIEIAAYDGAEGLGIVVKDRGIGISSDYIERIFHLFQRAVGRDVEGTGAGLAIVRQVAEQHGGHAWAKPREGGGTEFMITFGSGVHPADALSCMPKVISNEVML